MSDTTHEDTDDDAPGMTGQEMLEDAFLTYRDLGLRLPPVPVELVDALDELSSTTYGTADVDLFDVAGFTARARDAATATMVGFGQLGHGVASWWFCYQVITPTLGLFIRLPFGGIVSDDADSAEAVNQALALAEELVVAADEAGTRDALAGGRAIVVLDGLEQGFVQIGDEGTARTSDDSIAEALTALRTG